MVPVWYRELDSQVEMEEDEKGAVLLDTLGVGRTDSWALDRMYAQQVDRFSVLLRHASK